MSLFVQAVRANQTDGVRFSLTVLDQTLEDVLSDIEQITGLTLIVDSNIKSVPFSGVYNNVTVCEFFSYAVKEKNITVSVNSEQKIVTVSKIRPSKSNHGDYLACEMEDTPQAQQSMNKPSNDEMRDLKTGLADHLTGTTWTEAEEQVRPSAYESKSAQSHEDVLTSEMDYIIQTQQFMNTPSNNEMRDLKTNQADRVTGRTWSESEEQVRPPAHESKSAQLHEDFLASEMEYIIQAQQSINRSSNNEMRDLETDRLTGKTWSEVEQQNRPSVYERKRSQLSQDDFLASESDYIAKVKMTAKNAQKRDRYEENIDPMSGKNWEEIEAEMQ